VLLSLCLARSAPTVDFVRDGTIVLEAVQINDTTDGINPGQFWEASVLFPAPVTIAAGDTLRGTLSFGADLLRIQDNGGGFFQVGATTGLEQLIAIGPDPGPAQETEQDNAVRFTDVRGAALVLGEAQVNDINASGLFMQAADDFVATNQEFFASGGVYRLGLVGGGGPFTIDRVTLRVIAEEIGIAPRPTGDLAYRNCITGETDSGPGGGTDACALGNALPGGDNSGLNNLRSVAESPDGTSLYVVSGFDDALAHFDRDPNDGTFSYVGCFTGEIESGPTGSEACALINGATANGEDSGLDLPQAVAVSADGKSVYTASIGDDAVARFDRDPVTGALTYQGCITGEEGSNATTCTAIASASTNGTDSGLDGVRALALSADGKSLYAIAAEDDAVARFDRDPATGALTYQGCITGETESGPGPTGSNACTLIGSATSFGTNSGIDGPFAVAVSPDGVSVYAVSTFDDAVARFDRDPATGALTYQGCISGETQSGPGPAGSGACALIGSAASDGNNSGLDNLFALALSADGTSLYAVAEQDDAVARFDRSPTGALTYQGCITGETESGPATGTDACAEVGSATSGGSDSGFDKFRSVGVSADGLSVYAASPADDALVRFDRDPGTGALLYQNCISARTQNGPTGTQACALIGSATPFGSNSGLDNPQAFVVSGDGSSLYAASGNDAALARFDRQPEPPPTTTTTSTSTTSTTTVVVPTSTTTTATTTSTVSTTTVSTTSVSTTTAPTTSTTSTSAATSTTTSATTTTAPTSTTTTTLPGACDGLPGLLGAECELLDLIDQLVATPEEDLGGVKQNLLKKTNRALRLVRRAQGAEGRILIVNPRKARGALRTFIAIIERRVQRGKIVDVALADELIAQAEAIRAQLLEVNGG
jgi:6-phosphogluconolactonase (cycloisomerase 2 family)